jgi:hypothetical protein
MKTWKMEVEEIQLLEKLANFSPYEKLASFFNRSETTIRDNIYRIHNKRSKYFYYKPKTSQNNQPFNGKIIK